MDSAGKLISPFSPESFCQRETLVPALPWFSIVAKQDNMHEKHHGFIEIMSYSDKNYLNHASGDRPKLLFNALNFISSIADCQIFVHELNFIALLYLTALCRGICVTMSKPLEGFKPLVHCRENFCSFNLAIGLELPRMGFLITFSLVFSSNKPG